MAKNTRELVGNRLEKGDSGLTRRLECDHAHLEPLLIRRKSRRAMEKKMITGPMRFVSLHHHSTFSALDGFQLPEAHVRRATELNMGAIAMTEHGNVSSHDKLEVASRKLGVKPIYGCEIYTGYTDPERRTQRKYHLTVLAKDLEGYRNLLAMVSESWRPSDLGGGFYYEPTVSWEMLKKYKKGLIILSGCQGSLLFCSTVGGKLVEESSASYARGRRVASAFKREFGDSYYIEVQAFPDLAKTREFNPLAERMARELGIGLVATMDCHYTVPEEQEIQIVLHNVRGMGKQTLEEQVRSWGYDEYLCPPPTDSSLYRRLRATGLSKLAAQEAIINTEVINTGLDDYDLPHLPMLRYPLPEGYTSSEDLLRDMLREGWKYRKVPDAINNLDETYKERMLRELKLIVDKDYIDYFLITADMVIWAKDNGIPVGPARGSAAGSLICWLLRITEVNPMLFPNLIFERFIDESRMDLPDIDLDFCSDQRYKVREYLVSKYGKECVNNIGTFQYYKSKNSLDDVARVYKIPGWKIDQVKDLLVERSSGDLRASATIEDTVGQFEKAKEVFDEYPDLYKATDLEGNVRGIGVHAAGLVVSNGPITDVCAVYTRKVKDTLTEVVSVDKYDAERRGLIKIDVLALNTMSVISEALKHIGMKVQDLYDLPLDDPKVIKGFQESDVIGIFQFDGRAMRQVNSALKPDDFKEICDVNALSRPGPLHNGAAGEYIAIKNGDKKPDLIHPSLSDITGHTHFQIVYQEQILRIVVELGDFDWTHAALIRKIMSKKHGEAEFNSHWIRFWTGVQKNVPDMEEHVAKNIWGMLITAGAYAFNYAHCVSYGMLAYWTMWLKQYHPDVFFAASLSKLDPKKHTELLRDAATGHPGVGRKPLEVLPPDPSFSGVGWTPEGTAVQAGLKQIEGVGDKTADAIIAYREEFGVDGWEDLINVKGIGPKTIERIREFVASDDPFGIFYIDRAIDEVKDFILKTHHPKFKGEVLPMPTHNGVEIPYKKDEHGRDEQIVWIGVVKNRNLRDIFESNRARTGQELNPDDVDQPELNEFMLMLGYDGFDLVGMRFDRFKYPQFRESIWDIDIDKDLVLVRGVKPGWRDAREIYVHDMWVISP